MSKAKILDINTVVPQQGESYFVDTNVWYWMTYASSKHMSADNAPKEYQVADYPNFIQKALDNGVKLYHCGFTLSELSNIIENAEWRSFICFNPDQQKISKKNYRRKTQERRMVVKEVKAAWDSINAMSNCIDVDLNTVFLESAHQIYSDSLLDSYDSFITEVMNQYNIDNVITDDGDFSSLTNKNVFTSNPRMLN
jgi:predicted nucleic acid-binding protein